MALYANTQKLYLGSPASGHDAISRRNNRRARIPAIRAAAASSSTSDVAYEKGQLERPKWAGETPLSRLVGAVISFKPIYSLLKLGARTAEKNDIPWREMTRQILESDVYKELESIQNPSLVFPDYYLSPFHAYDEGNLSWMRTGSMNMKSYEILRRAAILRWSRMRSHKHQIAKMDLQ